jgi:uncharacterized membrane protein YozB (DUF420 family)
MLTHPEVPRPGRLLRLAAWSGALFLSTVVLVFIAIRVTTDLPHVIAGSTPPPGEFDHRYSAYAWLAYAHIVPGAIYVLAAPWQLSLRFRSRHPSWHRRIGRVAVSAGILSGLFAVIFGGFFSYGGWLEAAAAVFFGLYLVVALATAYRAIRGGDVQRHRRWMIRAFAVGIAVGTIRLWIGLFEAAGLLSFDRAFGPAFWLAFFMHVVVAELWLSRYKTGVATLPAQGSVAARPTG